VSLFSSVVLKTKRHRTFESCLFRTQLTALTKLITLFVLSFLAVEQASVPCCVLSGVFTMAVGDSKQLRLVQLCVITCVLND
jgi:hypothetical protein